MHSNNTTNNAMPTLSQNTLSPSSGMPNINNNTQQNRMPVLVNQPNLNPTNESYSPVQNILVCDSLNPNQINRKA